MRRLLARLGVHRFALRDALRTAVVMPAAFAVGELLIGDAQLALFAAFGSVALLVFADFGGPPRSRLIAYVALALASLPLVALGTLCSRSPLAATVAMAAVAFGILFCGVLDGHVAAAAPAAILAFVLSVMVPAPLDEVGGRLAGWALAATFAIAATMLLWPRRPRDLLRARAADACRALAACVEETDEAARDEVRAAVTALRRQFAATPYRPSGVAGPTAELAHLVTDLGWLTPLALAPPADGERDLDPSARELRAAVVALLRACAPLLETRHDHAGDALARRRELERTRAALADAFERTVGEAADAHDGQRVEQLLDAAFHLRVLSYSAWLLGGHALGACGIATPDDGEPEPEYERRLAAVAEAGRLAAAHVSMRSVWLRNSARGAIALSAAVLIGQLADVQHAFWIVLGTLSVLRSHALDTGATALRALAGTFVGIAAGALLVELSGDRDAILWALLPPATLLAAYAPRAVSFAAGQAAFSMLVIVLFNLVQPTGWTVGLLRIEDVAIGCAVSLAVGALFWPRGAAAVMREHLAEAYASGADDVAATVGGLLGERTAEETARASAAALAAGLRLDAAFRQFLAERSSARTSFQDLALLVAGAARVRRAAAMLRSTHALQRVAPHGDAADAPGRAALSVELDALRTWLLAFAGTLDRGEAPPAPGADAEGPAARVADWAREAVVAEDGDLDLRRVLGIAWTSRHLALLTGTEPRLAEAARGVLGHRSFDGAAGAPAAAPRS